MPMGCSNNWPNWLSPSASLFKKKSWPVTLVGKELHRRVLPAENDPGAWYIANGIGQNGPRGQVLGCPDCSATPGKESPCWPRPVQKIESGRLQKRQA